MTKLSNEAEVSAWMLARLERRRGPLTDTDKAWRYISDIAAAGVTSAETADASRRLMRLADDVEQNQERSVLGRVLSGELDLLAAEFE